MGKTLRQREAELKAKEKQWEKEKDIVEREQNLRREKMNVFKRHFQKPSTSKLLILFLFINCTIIEIFTGWVTIKSLALVALTGLAPDFTPLVTLIGAIVSEVIGYAVYSLKSMKENTAGGIVFEKALAEIHIPEENPNDAPQEPDLTFINIDDDAVG